jgi:hypothetical protein
MKTVVDENITEHLAANGHFYVMHRFDLDTVAYAKSMRSKGLLVSVSSGVQAADYDVIDRLAADGVGADYITIDGTPLSNMELSGGAVDNEAMEAAMLYMLDQQLDAVNSGDVDVEDLGYSISDLNKLARAENLLYTPGTEKNANTKDHRGNPVEGAGFDDEWIKRISSEDGRYGAGRTNRAIPVKNFADDMFQAYGGLGYLDYDDVSDETRKRYGRG